MENAFCQAGATFWDIKTAPPTTLSGLNFMQKGSAFLCVTQCLLHLHWPKSPYTCMCMHVPKIKQEVKESSLDLFSKHGVLPNDSGLLSHAYWFRLIHLAWEEISGSVWTFGCSVCFRLRSGLSEPRFGLCRSLLRTVREPVVVSAVSHLVVMLETGTASAETAQTMPASFMLTHAPKEEVGSILNT